MREVWLEVQMQHALSLAKPGQCSEATRIADQIAQPVSDMQFTQDGLEPFLRSARLNYLLGTVYKACGGQEKAAKHFQRATEQSESSVWSWRASQQLPNFDPKSAKAKLQASLDHMRSAGESGSPSGWWLYNAALLDRALGNAAQAKQEISEALFAARSIHALPPDATCAFRQQSVSALRKLSRSTA